VSAQALQAPPPQRMQQLLPGSSPPAAGSPPGDGDVDMAAADSVVAPIILHNEREPVRGWTLRVACSRSCAPAEWLAAAGSAIPVCTGASMCACTAVC
jgi:hypothetical protein